ncbi:kiwellin-like [Malania oleifera]|uniref:kiwellin-like n=1 Tax=Malania oleifera TaxID=397392 RepID=UPI0025ADE0C9|nr:kiwellin-like [Malania oleifera]
MRLPLPHHSQVFLLLSLPLLLTALSLLSHTRATSPCGGPCQNTIDCDDDLIWSDRKCSDDPVNNVHISNPGDCGPGGGCPGGGGSGCGEGPSGVASGPLSGDDDCHPSYNLTCVYRDYPIFNCSPPVTACTHARLMNVAFKDGGQGELPSTSCNKNGTSANVVALSTGWFANMTRCGQMIRIWANGRNVTAEVVGECDSTAGCDTEHAMQPPCGPDVVDASDAVWRVLGLNASDTGVDVTWAVA